ACRANLQSQRFENFSRTCQSSYFPEFHLVQKSREHCGWAVGGLFRKPWELRPLYPPLKRYLPAGPICQFLRASGAQLKRALRATRRQAIVMLGIWSYIRVKLKS